MSASAASAASTTSAASAGEDPELIRIKTALSYGACSDAKHDFSGKIGEVKGTEKNHITMGDVLTGLPSFATDSIHFIKHVKSESDLLKELLNSVNTANFTTMPAFIDSLASSNFTKTIDIMGITPHTYTVKLLNCREKPASPGKAGSPGKPAFPATYNARKFFNNIYISEYREFFNLGAAEDLNLVIDAQTIGINFLFGYAIPENDEGMNVYSIVNREVINDPAPKTYNMASFKSSNKVKYNVAYDSKKENIIYSKYDNSKGDKLMRTMFFSIFDFSLSSLIMKGNSLPRINMDITSNNKYIYQTDNPHITNRIESCWTLIKELFSFGVNTAHERHIKCSAMFQCKRSGDWLQALSCLDEKREYEKTDKSPHIINGKLKLVTHDRILLWFALFIGIDVIFTCFKAVDVPEYLDESTQLQDDFSDDNVEGKREKILLYFSSGVETEQSKLERYTLLFNAISQEEHERMFMYAINYNRWIQDIVEGINNEINIKYNEALETIRGNQRYTTRTSAKTIELIQAYFRLVSIDYIELNVPKISELTLKNLGEYLSNYDSFKRTMDKIPTKETILILSKNNILNDIYTNIVEPFEIKPDKEKNQGIYIKIAKLVGHLQFRLTDEYTNQLIQQLTDIVTKGRSIWLNASDKKYRIDQIIEILRRDNLEKMSETVCKFLKVNAKDQATSIQEACGGGGGSGPVCNPAVMLQVESPLGGTTVAPLTADEIQHGEFIPNVTEISEDAYIASLPGVYNEDRLITIAEHIKNIETSEDATEIEQEKKHIQYITEMATKAAAAQVAVSSAEVSSSSSAALPPLAEAVAEDTSIIKITMAKQAELFARQLASSQAEPVEGEGEPGEPGEPVKVSVKSRLNERRKKRIFNMVSPDFTMSIKDFFYSLPSNTEGGGNKEKCYYTIFLSYLNTLMGAIQGFDSANLTDYIYYDTLVRIVLSCIKTINNDYEELLILTYSIIPEGNWDLDKDTITSDPLKKCVMIAAENIALQNLNMREGDLPYISDNETYILNNPAIKEKIRMVTLALNKLNFRQRKIYLILRLANAINTLQAPKDSVVPIRVHEKISPSQLHLQDSEYYESPKKISRIVEPLITQVSAHGGYKTRHNKRKVYRGRKGSPKRRTLRKTRKHK